MCERERESLNGHIPTVIYIFENSKIVYKVLLSFDGLELCSTVRTVGERKSFGDSDIYIDRLYSNGHIYIFESPKLV